MGRRGLEGGKGKRIRGRVAGVGTVSLREGGRRESRTGGGHRGILHREDRRGEGPRSGDGRRLDVLRMEAGRSQGVRTAVGRSN